MAGSTDPSTAFAPLFIRNAVGCIIVGKASNTKTLTEYYRILYLIVNL